VIKYSPVKETDKIDPNGKYFQGNMGDLKTKGHTIYLETKF
jgi:hypothetical protein